MSSMNAHRNAVAGRRMVTASVIVNRGQDSAFATFVDRLADWWPLQTYSLGRDRIKTVVVEKHEGGRIYEVHADDEKDWGVITSWDPPHGFVLRWEVMPGPATHVELNFEKVADNVTRVSVEHTGWENVDSSLVQDCDYSAGWRETLARFADQCANQPTG